MARRRANDSLVNITDELQSTGLDPLHVDRGSRLYEECHSGLNSHQQRSDLLKRMSVFFGLPIAVLAAVSGTAAFATLGQEVGNSWRLLVIILSLTITVLSTIQTFFRFSEQAAKEQDAANRYSALQWEIRRWANTPHDRGEASVASFIDDVISEMQDIDARYRGIELKRRAEGGSPPPRDTTPPELVTTTPLDLAVDVHPLIRPTAGFSKDMDRSTINPNSFKLLDLVELAQVPPKVPNGVDYDVRTRMATFTPAAALHNGRRYQAIITAAVKDQAGNSLSEDWTWHFEVSPQR